MGHISVLSVMSVFNSPQENTMPNTTANFTVIETKSAVQTEALGRRLAAVLPPGAVVTLYGNLGAGKTVLARGVARGMGITEPVTSPTFAIVQEYRAPHDRWFYHLDLYRIRDDADALAFGIEEYLFNPASVTVVEWPERIPGLLADTGPDGKSAADLVFPIHIESLDETHRRFKLPAGLELPPA